MLILRHIKKAIKPIYELGAPKFDVYTTEVWDKKWEQRSNRRCFASFGEAYLWGLKQVSLKKEPSKFCIIGEKFKRSVYEKNVKDWYDKPFNRLDCEEVFWI